MKSRIYFRQSVARTWGAPFEYFNYIYHILHRYLMLCWPEEIEDYWDSRATCWSIPPAPSDLKATLSLLFDEVSCRNRFPWWQEIQLWNWWIDDFSSLIEVILQQYMKNHCLCSFIRVSISNSGGNAGKLSFIYSYFFYLENEKYFWRFFGGSDNLLDYSCLEYSSLECSSLDYSLESNILFVGDTLR